MIEKYNAIFEWNMKNDEIEAYKIAICYENEILKIFGKTMNGSDLRKNSLPKRNDPRKSNLFRYCWKLLRETRGLLEPHEYKNYIIGNLKILEIQKAYIGPNAICGDKAWIRYKVWKRMFDAKMAEVSAIAPPPSVSTTDPKIIQQIDRTKKFIFERCEGTPSFEKVKKFFDDGILKFWVMTSKISIYYLMMSPWISKTIDLEKFATECAFSSFLYKSKITTEVKNYFSYEFKHEYI